MAPSRRLTAGRSPLVRKQSQITAFFSAGQASRQSPSPRPSPIPDASPSQPEEKKPRLVIPPYLAPDATTPPSAAKGGFRGDVVGRRIKVFWSLDKAWHEGRVSSFYASQGKHLVLYDDGEEEALDLSCQKFEWLEEDPPRRLRRLRRLSGTVEKACSAVNLQDGIGEEDGTGDEERSKAELEDDDGEIVSDRFRRSTASKKRRILVGAPESLDCTKKLNFGGN